MRFSAVLGTLLVALCCSCGECPGLPDVMGPSTGSPCADDGAAFCAETPERDPWTYVCVNGVLETNPARSGGPLERCARNANGEVSAFGRQASSVGGDTCPSPSLEVGGDLVGPLSGRECAVEWSTRCADDVSVDDHFYVCFEGSLAVLDYGRRTGSARCVRSPTGEAWVRYGDRGGSENGRGTGEVRAGLEQTHEPIDGVVDAIAEVDAQQLLP